MELLLNKLRATTEYQTLLKQVQGDVRVAGLGLPRAARLPVLAALHADLNRPILLLTDRADHALGLFDELGFWTKAPRLFYSEPAPLFYEDAAWGASTRRERLQTLIALSAYHLPFAEKPQTHPIMVASVRAVMTRTLPRRDFLKACKRLSAGQSISTETLIRQWDAIGYQHADTVLDMGQFSRRGGILDIWIPSEPQPVRLDFFGDEIETIRAFDPATQRTTAKLESVLVSPAREYLINNQRLETGDSDQSLVSSLQSSITEFSIPILHPMPASVLDYLPQRALILVDDLTLAESIASEVEEQAVKSRHEAIEENLIAPDFPIPYITWSEISDNLQSHPLVELGHSTEVLDNEGIKNIFSHDERFGGRLKPFMEHLKKISEAKNQIVIVSRQSKRLEEMWNETTAVSSQQLAVSEERLAVSFVDATLSEGFILNLVSPLRDSAIRSQKPFTTQPAENSPISSLQSLHLITDSEIFGWERPAPRTRAKTEAEAPESVYSDLRPGDYVVHVDHGIGRYTGLIERTMDGHEREYLAVEYESEAMVFIPVHQADRLTRYVGAENGIPTLSRLGGTSWSETKERVREAVKEIAEDLLDLYARRHVAEGFSFKADTQWQKELEDSFPYVETEDQLKALEAIKRDMESPRPMDRLLCGDVGYGKTEVALRAAFKAVMDGKQVALLVPTTVLAQQHFDTFRQRLAAFPVKVEMLSRFRTAREQDEILRQLLLGNVDILIGTHRLISQDVEFKDLGLAIIDEEQRFGVTHKEHLKTLRTQVDVLTLTATPIPRTLYMALTGVRDISNLNTPPEERLPIITHVGPYSQRLVRQAILRELERGGQIFFVHNRVQTIHAMQLHLKKLVPEARIAVGHGQMNEHELSNVMHQFTDGEIDILLSTTIVESGLDIPNANTLIVDRADTFGLAQLYQLRGRVGRGAQRAYAYFFRHRKKSPTLEGQERLEVIAENTQLGAGYSIAMRDLEIRGAGELLGTRQSGHIASVGFHLYTRMLAAEVKRLRRAAASAVQTDPHSGIMSALASIPLSTFDELAQELKEPVTVDLPLAIGIPRAYISNQDLRLRLYRRLAALKEERELDAFFAEFNDRFGAPPKMVENLFYQMRVKLRADASGLQSVGIETGQIVLRYPVLSENMAQRTLSDLGAQVRGGKNAYWCSFLKDEKWMERLLDVLQRLKDKTVDIVLNHE